jgi:hypothetical protein
MELNDLSRRSGNVIAYLRILCEVLEQEYQKAYTFGLTTEEYAKNIRRVAVYEMITHYPYDALCLHDLFGIKNDFDFYGKDLMDGLTQLDLDIRKRIRELNP